MCILIINKVLNQEIFFLLKPAYFESYLIFTGSGASCCCGLPLTKTAANNTARTVTYTFMVYLEI